MPAHSGLRVFIIDDNEMTRGLLRVIIQGDKYEVVGDSGSADTLDHIAAQLRQPASRA